MSAHPHFTNGRAIVPLILLWSCCISPLLFNILVRNLQFANGTTVVEKDPSLPVVAEKLKAAFDHVKHFCDSHELKINLEKTQLILFKKPGKLIPDDFHLTLDNCTGTPQKTVKLLGVTLDQHLTYGPHILIMWPTNVTDFWEF